MLSPKKGQFGFVACSLATLALILLPNTSQQAGPDDPKKAKEVFGNYATVVNTVNPVAGALFKGAKEFLDLTGYFGTAKDPIADAIKRINERLDAIDAKLAALETAVQKVQNELFRTQNLARIRKLRDFQDRLHGITDRLQPALTNRVEKIALANDARRIAEKFLIDEDLWIWSDFVLESHTWQDKAMTAGSLLDPEFKPWPTMEYYTLALVTWMTAAEYAAEGDKSWVKQTYGAELTKHVDFLSVRPGWTPLAGPGTSLPERVRERIKGWFVPDRYPENMVCHFAEFTTDTIAREIRHVYTFTYPAKRSDEFCTVPEGLWNRPTNAEEELERAHGADVMWMLADRLRRLRDYGTVREQFIGTFSAAAKTTVPAFLYAVRPDGKMSWFRHDGADFGTENWVGPSPVSEGWGDLRQVVPGGGNIIHSVTNDGKFLWYRHNGFNTGAPDSPAHVASRFVPYEAPNSRAFEVDPLRRAGPPSLNSLAAKGELLSKADPLATELRNREPDASGRRGFDIGMAAAEGQTVPGPGKDATRASLPAAERSGFSTAVAFSLERNRNAERARKGAAIAKADPAVEKARTADPDVFYWLGFDIATAIFGDPGLGAQGNTATGPGSLAVRDALSAAGQRGFNAAVKFHLARDYKRTSAASIPVTRAGTKTAAPNSVASAIANFVPAGPRQWDGAKDVGAGWNGFRHVFSGGNGVMYAVTQAGKLMYYVHTGHKGGERIWEPAKEVGSGWGDYKTVFSAGDGIVYAVTHEGKLLWFKHVGFAQGAKSWLGPKEIQTVGTENWADYKHVFSAGIWLFGKPGEPRVALDKSVIYAIDQEGKLYWYGHRGYDVGAPFQAARKLVGTGWGDFVQVMALLSDRADAVR